MQYSQEHLKTMVYAKFGGQTECIMGNWKIENRQVSHSEQETIWIILTHPSPNPSAPPKKKQYSVTV